MVSITVENIWSMNTVREMCIKHRLYTEGNVREYDAMLNKVDRIEPDTMGIYVIAKDIYKHSKGQTITNVMFLLRREAVHTHYNIDEE